jgi:hypothetical protein
MHPFVAKHLADGKRLHEYKTLEAQIAALERQLKGITQPKERRAAEKLLAAGKKKLEKLRKAL